MSSDSDHFEGDSDSDNELDLTLPFNPADHRASSPSAVIVNEGTKSPCLEKQDDTEQTRDINTESPQTNVAAAVVAETTFGLSLKGTVLMRS